MSDITIPPEAVEAARTALEKCNGGQQFYLNEVEPAIRAALAAWPGMMTERRARCDAVVLPFNLDADIMQESKE